jgi:hypothetical protein
MELISMVNFVQIVTSNVLLVLLTIIVLSVLEIESILQLVNAQMDFMIMVWKTVWLVMNSVKLVIINLTIV